MSKPSNKPSHRLVRYYGEGKAAPRAEVGVIFTGADGRATIIINGLNEQIRLMAFPIEPSETERGSSMSAPSHSQPEQFRLLWQGEDITAGLDARLARDWRHGASRISSGAGRGDPAHHRYRLSLATSRRES